MRYHVEVRLSFFFSYLLNKSQEIYYLLIPNSYYVLKYSSGL